MNWLSVSHQTTPVITAAGRKKMKTRVTNMITAPRRTKPTRLQKRNVGSESHLWSTRDSTRSFNMPSSKGDL